MPTQTDSSQGVVTDNGQRSSGICSVCAVPLPHQLHAHPDTVGSSSINNSASNPSPDANPQRKFCFECDRDIPQLKQVAHHILRNPRTSIASAWSNSNLLSSPFFAASGTSTSTIVTSPVNIPTISPGSQVFFNNGSQLIAMVPAANITYVYDGAGITGQVAVPITSPQHNVTANGVNNTMINNTMNTLVNNGGNNRVNAVVNNVVGGRNGVSNAVNTGVNNVFGVSNGISNGVNNPVARMPSTSMDIDQPNSQYGDHNFGQNRSLSEPTSPKKNMYQDSTAEEFAKTPYYKAITTQPKKKPRKNPNIFNKPKKSFEQRFSELVAFKEIHGHCDVPQRPSKDLEHHSLGIWVRNMRHSYKLNKLKPETVSKLESIGFKWGFNKKPKCFDEYFQELVGYRSKYGHCDVPSNSEEYLSLGRWCNSIRSSYKVIMDRKEGEKRVKNKLTLNQIQRLESIGFKWSIYRKRTQDDLLLVQQSESKDVLHGNM